MTENEKYWRDFEARDRKAHPAAWAVHDNMTKRKKPDDGFRLYLSVLVFILLAVVAFLFWL